MCNCYSGGQTQCLNTGISLCMSTKHTVWWRDIRISQVLAQLFCMG
jgi:hypothetical protein